MVALTGTTAETQAARKRAVIYVRISKDRKGTGTGVARQEDLCRALAATHPDWEVVAVYTDNDVSAYSGRVRKDYRRMLAAIQAGHVDVVIVWHHDRLHRSCRELEEYIDVCQTGAVVPTYAVQASTFGMDLTTANGQLTARFGAAMAQHEAMHMSERIVEEKKSRILKGDITGGQATFGYERGQWDHYDEDGTPDGNLLNADRVNRRAIPAEAAMFKKAVKRVLAGDTVYAICRDWRAAGIRTAHGNHWYPISLRRALVNPKYAGLVTYQGDVVPDVRGLWDAIISEDEHHALVAILKDSARSTYDGPRSLKWLGSGVYLCTCGNTLRSGGTRSRPGNPLTSYRCDEMRRPHPKGQRGSHVSIRSEWADEYVRVATCALLVREGAALLNDADDGALVALRTERQMAQQVLDRLYDDFYDAQGNAVAQRQLQRQLDRFGAKMDAINARLEMMGDGADPLVGVADAPDPQKAFLDLNVERQRAVVSRLWVVRIGPSTVKGRPRGGTPILAAQERVQLERRENAVEAA